MNHDSNRRDYIMLNREGAVNLPIPPTQDMQGQLHINRDLGPPDCLQYVRLNTAGTAYEYAKVVTFSDLLPVANIDASALTDGLLLTTSGVISSTVDPSVNSLVVAGGIRAGGTNGTPTITFGTSAGTTASIGATFAGGDAHGEFALTPNGAGISTGAMVTITFQTALANNNYDVIWMPRNSNAALIHMHTGTRANGSVQLSFATAPVAGQVYGVSYWVVGR